MDRVSLRRLIASALFAGVAVLGWSSVASADNTSRDAPPPISLAQASASSAGHGGSSSRPALTTTGPARMAPAFRAQPARSGVSTRTNITHAAGPSRGVSPRSMPTHMTKGTAYMTRALDGSGRRH